jgi:hypothetical protein
VQLRSPHEARLLAVERGLNAMDRDLRRLKQSQIALWEQIWDAWNDEPAGIGTSSPPPPPPTTIPITCHGGISVLLNLPFTDSIFGSGTLVWDGVSLWTCCLSGLTYPGSLACSAATIAILYTFDTSCVLRLSWVQNSSSHCPVTSSCPPTPGFGQSLAGSVPTVTSTTAGPPATTTYTTGSSVSEQALRAGHTSQTITVQLPT